MPEYIVKLRTENAHRNKAACEVRSWQPCSDLAERFALGRHPEMAVLDISRRQERVESIVKKRWPDHA